MPAPAPYRLLLVDDNPAIHDDFRKILASPGPREGLLEATESILFGCTPPSGLTPVTFEIDSAHQGREALEKVKTACAARRPYALAFVDVRMPPGWDGVETIERLWAIDPALQCIICTAYSDYSWEKMSQRLRASDGFLILKKPFDNIEVLQLAHAMTKKWQMTQQAQMRMETLEEMCAERTQSLGRMVDKLRRSEDRFATVFRASPMPQAIQHYDGQHFVEVNEAFARLTGFGREELIGKTPLSLGLCLDIDDPNNATGKNGHHAVQAASAHISNKAGELRPALVSLERISIQGESHLVIMAQDVSERQRLEGQLRQAQKMEAIGQLAAGIAHDFNNLLTIIQGHSSLQLSQPGLTPSLRGSLGQIEGAASRAAELTRQLLAFSRRQIMQQRSLDLSALLRKVGAILNRLLGEHIQLSYELPTSLPPVYADPTNLEQVVMNLVVNARDAMPRGGRIVIAARAVQIEQAPLDRNPEAMAGEHVCLSVADNGTGMDEEIRARIFEPFFTTKEVHKGTGMGLATVYGIAQQHQGWVEVDSALGEGSTFRVYLPVSHRPAESSAPERQAHSTPARRHIVLVVEDDPSVRGLVREVLLQHGYQILEAESADAALLVWERHRNEIELVLTDIVMPGTLNGLELGQRLQSDAPELKVIYSSGYSADLFTTDLQLKDGENYLPKPYLFSKLTAIIYEALEGSGAMQVAEAR